MVSQLRNEVQIMTTLNHPNIVRLITHFEDQKNIYFIMELAEEGHLYSRLKKAVRFEPKIAAKYLFDIFQAVNCLHEQQPPIIHRDIKPENILFFGDILKLADFGWSNINQEKTRMTFCGTPDYLAPEMIMEKGKKYQKLAHILGHDEKLDV